MISHMMSYMISCTKHQIMVRLSSQVRFVNDSIDRARPDSVLYGLEHIEDPSDKIIEVHLASLRWDMEQRKFGLTGVGLQNVHDLSMELLDTLDENMPERAGGCWVGTLKSLTVLYTRYATSSLLSACRQKGASET